MPRWRSAGTTGFFPYRDLIGNNFPGTIYLFWVLGKVFGWGHLPPLYAVDAALLVALGLMLWLWSRARFQTALPGIVGYLMVLSYYLSLDYTLTAQRDWQAPLLAVLGLLAVQTWPNRFGAMLAALAMSSGLLIRPQVILLLPALTLAVAEGPRRAGASWIKASVKAMAWLIVVGLITAVGFLPLVRAGILDDFIRGVRAVAYGGTYSQNSLRSVVFLLIDELCVFKVLSVLIAVAVLSRSNHDDGNNDSEDQEKRTSRYAERTWLFALVCILIYAPVSPVTRPYLFHPLWLIWSVNVAVLVSLILRSNAPPNWQFFSIVLILGMGATARPDYCRPGSLSSCLAALKRARTRESSPRLSESLPRPSATAPLGRLSGALAVSSQGDDARDPRCQHALGGDHRADRPSSGFSRRVGHLAPRRQSRR